MAATARAYAMLKFALFVIVIVVCNVSAARAQVPSAQNYHCITPENYYGFCVRLTYCPQVVNIFQTTNRQVAQNYVIALQRGCGTRSVSGDPVVCCTRPQTGVAPTPAPARPQPQRPQPLPQPQPQIIVTTPRSNPFLPQTTTPRSNPFLQPTTQRPQIIAPVPTTTTTTPRPLITSAPLIDIRGPSCRGPDTREGYCIALKDCEEILNELYEKQTDKVFADYLRASNSICGGTSTLICCPSRGGSGNGGGNNAPVTAMPYSNEVPRRPPSIEEGCGYTINSFKKIVGGTVSKRGAWPWIALIGYDDGSSTPFKCGGTLISARHVLTAAHCIRRDLTFVRLGEHDLTTDSEAQHVDVKVVRYETNTQYNRRNGRSDIAILYLERNVQFNDNIAPICLPSTPELRRKSYVRYSPFVVGWGKTMEGGQSANILQELQIPIYENEVCRESYRKQDRLFSEDQFDEAVVCAGALSGGKDTCQGDSGGPLMIPEPYKDSARFYLIGIVSYGIGCARPEVPGVYTSTQYFMDWILQMVANTP